MKEGEHPILMVAKWIEEKLPKVAKKMASKGKHTEEDALKKLRERALNPSAKEIHKAEEKAKTAWV